jgi:hypothetical protein
MAYSLNKIVGDLFMYIVISPFINIIEEIQKLNFLYQYLLEYLHYRYMINKIDFNAKNLTSNAGIFLLFEHAKNNGIFDIIEKDLVFDNESTNKIKMNHIKTMLCV